MLDEYRKTLGSNANIETVCMDAVTFSQSILYSPYDRIFAKHVINLLSREQRIVALAGFYKQLAPKNGKLLIVHSGHTGEIYPFDEHTRNMFRKAKNVEILLDELKDVGFKQIRQETFTFEFPPNSVKAEDWIHIIENRLWTAFSKENINEQQMKNLIDHVKKQYESPNNFQTVDKQTIVTCSAE